MSNLKTNGVVNQLHNMLTNHPERMHSLLEVAVFKSNGKKAIERDEFEIYTNNPESKIREKVEKLKMKGGISTLKIKELKKTAENRYCLELEI